MDGARPGVSPRPDDAPGDEGVILGRQGEDEMSLDDFAESAGIIPHELLVRLGSRVPRVYMRGGEAVRSSPPRRPGKASQPRSLV